MSPLLLRALCAGGLALLVSCPARAQSYSFTRLAGLPPTRGAVDDAGSNARFNAPTAVATDAAGNVYVADTYNNAIRKVTASGVVSTLAGTFGVAGSADGTGTAATFSSPYALAVDAAGNVWVTDVDTHTVRRITPGGIVVTIAGAAGLSGSADGPGRTARFNSPVGIAVDGDGNVYVADRNNRTLRKIAPDGVVSTIAGLTGLGGTVDGTGVNARFNALSNLTLDASGNLYATDNSSHVIRKITPAGVATTVAGLAGSAGSTDGTGAAARFNGPNGITVDRDGNLYVADTSNELVRKITPDGVVTRLAGSSGAIGNRDGTAGRFYRPYGVSADSVGNVFVADANNHSIRKITSTGSVSLLAGGGGNFGGLDGAGNIARFYIPQGIAVDGAGVVYVGDTFNGAVRKISPAGNVSTFAGQLGNLAYADGTGEAARFGSPFGVALDSAGNLLVADAVYNAIRHVTPAALVRAFAGVPSLTAGSADGLFGTARISGAIGVAFDSNRNGYIADTGNHLIRKVSAATGEVTTLAGGVGVRGTTDGTGTAARFSSPAGIAVDPAGNIFVADNGNHAIRKVTPTGIVTTVAGLPGTSGSADGNAATARFYAPLALALDGAGNIFVADTYNSTIRRITTSGQVTTIGGLAGVLAGYAEGTGSNARFFSPSAIAVDTAGALYIADSSNSVIMKGALDTRPVIVAPLQSAAVQAGASFTFAVTATGGGLRYQWKLNGTPIPGATAGTYSIANAQPAAGGSYTVDITNSAGTTTSSPATLSIVTTTNVGRIINLAIRSQAGTGAQTLIVGLAIGGTGTTGSKPLLVRAVGPTLGIFGVPGVLADPKLELFSAAGKISENDDWGGSPTIAGIAGQVGAFAFGNTASKDAALYNPAFTPGPYSAQVTGNGGTTGVVLAEIYDATPSDTYTTTTPRLINVSARTQVGTGGDILIAGFVIGGQTSKNVLIRAVGPTLAIFGVPGALLDPKLELFSATGKINENDDWGGSAGLSSVFQSVGAFPIPGASKDAVLLVTLPPGNYTAQVSGVAGATGVALVEVYDVP